MTAVSYEANTIYVAVTFGDLALVKARNIPQRKWSKTKKAWACRPSLANLDYIKANFPDAKWSKDAKMAFEKADIHRKARDKIRTGEVEFDFSLLDFVPFAKRPFLHQKKALLLARDLPAFAYFMDQGTGKTKSIIDDAAHNFRQGKINALLVFSPNDVKTNWVAWPHMLEPGEKDAVDDHMPPDIHATKGVWISTPKGDEKKAWAWFEDRLNGDTSGQLIVLAVNYDALNVPRFFNFAMDFCRRFDVMIACDESTEIKTPGSLRSKAAKKIRKLCKVARIATGTPVIKRPLDAYSQFEFLDEDILGYGSFYAFKNQFAVMGGFKNKQVLTYRNLEELQEKIKSCSFRVTKDECFDLPPKQFQKIRVEMSKEQTKAYKSMKDEMFAEFKGDVITAPIAITQVMRLAQITGGYMTDGDKVMELVKPKSNPKFQAIMRLIEESGDQQMLVWCHFRQEIAGLVSLLKEQGIPFAEFHGGVTTEQRLRIRKDFAAGEYKVVVANQACAGRGIDEFKAASLVAYLSNSHDTEDRIQSEDRTHRFGSQRHKAINYYDILIPNTVDVKIIQTLRANKHLSDEIMQDGLRAWI